MSEETEKKILEKLEEIEEKIEDVEKRVEHIESEDSDIEKKEDELEEIEKEAFDEEKEIINELAEDKKKKFKEMLDWKGNIWEGCRYKEKVVTAREIDFRCSKLNGPCKFEDCPLNY